MGIPREGPCQQFDFSPDLKYWELREMPLILLDEQNRPVHMNPAEAKEAQGKGQKLELIGLWHLYRAKHCPLQVKMGQREIEIKGAVCETMELLGVPVLRRWGFVNDQLNEATHCIWNGREWVWCSADYKFEYNVVNKSTVPRANGRRSFLRIRLRVIHKESKKELFSVVLQRMGTEIEGNVMPNS